MDFGISTDCISKSRSLVKEVQCYVPAVKIMLNHKKQPCVWIVTSVYFLAVLSLLCIIFKQIEDRIFTT